MTFTGWLIVFAIMAAAILAAWLTARIRNVTVRRLLYVVGPLLPLLVYAIIGLAWACLPLEEGERCYGYGMGWTILSPFWASWLVAFLIGLGYARSNRSVNAGD
ncbi:hypothetical protein [Aurantiacibacter gangjinensis]|uniref:Uncharacterized protein n=1 Tax=Aurantiacibacter gangjinensis TaxID=502682 RepID=A0A0G9MPN8_9SPHN|nr:hypothetical protein [Aurantiacibacter gangjinensis]APE28448.1 hypothetical protein BMF35_a1619 [Aurantiacibacter gangjinensis]KLE32660.1 hypothetical protein AAW01_00965 [Aurantiacibacter gangjinensis]